MKEQIKSLVEKLKDQVNQNLKYLKQSEEEIEQFYNDLYNTCIKSEKYEMCAMIKMVKGEFV